MLRALDLPVAFDIRSKIKARRKINVAPVKVAPASLPASYDLDVTTIAKTRTAYTLPALDLPAALDIRSKIKARR
jgi:hypothetical protein